ncbi:MAG: beta-ketoacyl-[acyl-carrier-protein] synthase family protein [Defluviitaleaceae bacterium]|nr:beta-ketoacyl-[acyl-carrier-protein] synthase family protein [Defluviitaleaceae bacterium]
MSQIIVTGMGVISTAGFTLDGFWDTLYQGRVTYNPMDFCEDSAQYRIKIGAKILSREWKDKLPNDFPEEFGKTAQYAAGATLSALENAGFSEGMYDPARIAVVVGTTMGEISSEEEITRLKYVGLPIPDVLYKQLPMFQIAKAVALAAGAQGYLYAVPAACAAGNYAVAFGKKLLDWDKVDAVIAGGADVFSKVAFAGFQRLLSLAPSLCQPFDKNRKGLVVGEGCGMIIMERAGARPGQKRYGSILGAGLASNAYHMTAPHKEGAGESQAMLNAIKDAGLCSRDIDYISAHGTGTKANDVIESQAIRNVFGSEPPPVSSIKSMLGHSMGAASMLELIASFLMIKNQVILPTINHATPDSYCNIDCVPNEPRAAKLRRILSNSFAFGGQTSSILIGD